MGEPRKTVSCAGQRIACLAGFFGLFLMRWLTNRYVFPLYTEALAESGAAVNLFKDATVGSSALALTAVAVISMWHQRWLSGKTLPYASLGLLITGFCTTVAAQTGSGHLAVYTAGAVLVDVGCSLVCVMVCLGAMALSMREVCACVALGAVAAYAARAGLMRFDPQTGYLLFTVTSLATTHVSIMSCEQTLQQLDGHDAPAELAVTNPMSFLSLGHRLYVSLFAFEVAYGFAMTVGDFIEAASWSLPVLGLLACVALPMVFIRSGTKADWLLMFCILCVLAGIVSFPVADAAASAFGKASLSAGSNLFQALAFGMLATLGSRNRLGGPTVAAWGCAVMYLGIIIGANAGRFAVSFFADPSLVSAATAGAVVIYMAAMLVLLHNFSIKVTMDSIVDVPEADPTVTAPDTQSDIDAVCRKLADTHSLTARETEVLALLARGRNSPFIQNELGISYNTARTHVRHIYEKCGFHTQQELIDAVEKR